LLLPPFFEDLELFLAAILLTTFHAVRDLPVAPTWQKVPDRSGKLNSVGKGVSTTFNGLTESFIQFPAIVIFLARKYAIKKKHCQELFLKKLKCGPVVPR